jgi:hypothetical protein
MNNVKVGQEAADRWNRDNQTGVCVDVLRDDGTTLRTVTRSVAWVVGDGTPIVSVKGISGGYLLDRVTRVPHVNEAAEEALDYHRAAGACTCDACGKEYRQHPDDLNHPGYDGMPWLVRLCDGRLVKL